jgi:hypothetical protein
MSCASCEGPFEGLVPQPVTVKVLPELGESQITVREQKAGNEHTFYVKSTIEGYVVFNPLKDQQDEYRLVFPFRWKISKAGQEGIVQTKIARKGRTLAEYSVPLTLEANEVLQLAFVTSEIACVTFRIDKLS